MQEHFNFTNAQMEALSSEGVTVKQLYEWARNYSIQGSDEKMSYVNLFYYVDKKGDFNELPELPSKKIARMLFENLEIKQKIELSEYISDLEEKQF